MSWVYLNGGYVPADQARISVMDRGFLFADGVYEVIPVLEGKMYFLALHLDRLNANLEAIGIDYRCHLEEWEQNLVRLAGLNTAENQGLYMQITRGVSERVHAPPGNLEATVFAMSISIRSVDRAKGVSVIVREDTRWSRCNLKTISLLPNVLFREEARRAEVLETVLTRDGYISEGAASNVFIVKSGLVQTPARSHHILPGITRQIVLDLLGENGVACREEPIPVSLLYDAEEVWLTASTLEILPVVKVDDRVIGDGVPGDIWRLADKLYQQHKQGNAESVRCMTLTKED